MFQRISQWLYLLSKGWVALIGLTLFLLFSVLVLPGQSAAMVADSGQAGVPDLSFFYTPRELYNMAGVYGEAGRQAYIHSHLTFDVLWPLVYLFFLTTAISWTLNRILPSASTLRKLNLLPLAAVLLDFGENISAMLVMARYPAHTAVIDWLAPIFTMLKWVGVGLSILILLTGLIILFVGMFRRHTDAA